MQDYGFRLYSPAMGRFLSVDPLTARYPMLKPDQFASNRPIDGTDIDGAEYNDVKLKFQTEGRAIYITGELEIKARIVNLSLKPLTSDDLERSMKRINSTCD